uniref:WIF domain-containing protein n=1 Tax=Steinernema glaseri TaxID=37863 RepID=A0A1I8AKQ9_9BILA
MRNECFPAKTTCATAAVRNPFVYLRLGFRRTKQSCYMFIGVGDHDRYAALCAALRRRLFRRKGESVHHEGRDEQDARTYLWFSVFSIILFSLRLQVTVAGIVAEMNYLENGVVNSYSTKFPYRVAANVHQVVFSWYTEVTDRPIQYAIRAVATDVNVLPVIRIQPNGVMPTSPETFVVEYRCAGSRAGQFGVFLHVNITWPSVENPTYVTLKQEKICSSRDGRRLGGELLSFSELEIITLKQEIQIREQ